VVPSAAGKTRHAFCAARGIPLATRSATATTAAAAATSATLHDVVFEQ
jgi:hypothetical protein